MRRKCHILIKSLAGLGFGKRIDVDIQNYRPQELDKPL